MLLRTVSLAERARFLLLPRRAPPAGAALLHGERRSQAVAAANVRRQAVRPPLALELNGHNNVSGVVARVIGGLIRALRCVSDVMLKAPGMRIPVGGGRCLLAGIVGSRASLTAALGSTGPHFDTQLPGRPRTHAAGQKRPYVKGCSRGACGCEPRNGTQPDEAALLQCTQALATVLPGRHRQRLRGALASANLLRRHRPHVAGARPPHRTRAAEPG